jgi:hypothetical protein
MQVLVVGARIGRLTTAVALVESGFDSHVHKPADVVRAGGSPCVGDVWSPRLGAL